MDCLLSFVPASCFTGLGQIDTVRHFLLLDLYRVLLNMFDDERTCRSRRYGFSGVPSSTGNQKSRAIFCESLVSRSIHQGIRCSCIIFCRMVGAQFKAYDSPKRTSGLNFCWLCVTSTSADLICFGCRWEESIVFCQKGMWTHKFLTTTLTWQRQVSWFLFPFFLVGKDFLVRVCGVTPFPVMPQRCERNCKDNENRGCHYFSDSVFAGHGYLKPAVGVMVGERLHTESY